MRRGGRRPRSTGASAGRCRACASGPRRRRRARARRWTTPTGRRSPPASVFNPTQLTADVTGPFGVKRYTYDGATRTATTVSPGGRSRPTTVDARGRPVRLQVGDPAAAGALAPGLIEYGADAARSPRSPRARRSPLRARRRRAPDRDRRPRRPAAGVRLRRRRPPARAALPGRAHVPLRPRPRRRAHVAPAPVAARGHVRADRAARAHVDVDAAGRGRLLHRGRRRRRARHVGDARRPARRAPVTGDAAGRVTGVDGRTRHLRRGQRSRHALRVDGGAGVGRPDAHAELRRHARDQADRRRALAGGDDVDLRGDAADDERPAGLRGRRHDARLHARRRRRADRRRPVHVRARRAGQEPERDHRRHRPHGRDGRHGGRPADPALDGRRGREVPAGAHDRRDRSHHRPARGRRRRATTPTPTRTTRWAS